MTLKQIPQEVRDAWNNEESVSPEEIEEICTEVETQLNQQEVKQ